MFKLFVGSEVLLSSAGKFELNKLIIRNCNVAIFAENVINEFNFVSHNTYFAFQTYSKKEAHRVK